jgi:uncharacterized protein (TIGR00369 family)
MADDLITALGRHMASTVPQAAALGLEFVSAAQGRGSIRVPWRADLVGDPEGDVIAGGVVISLIDHTCGLAVASAAATMPFSTATLDLRIDYLRAAKARAGVTAEAHCYKLTRNIAFVRAQAWDDDPADLIATAQAAFMVNR